LKKIIFKDFFEFKFKCSIGKNGITSKKIEGDNKTPKGTYTLGSLYFRKDRLSKPLTKINTKQIKKNLGWCDDVRSKHYNKLIKNVKIFNL
jgi:L,D-peptidoglycan transpeptidase YkuD (ErfK/YbiS/YcfS/YnhG family)